MVGSPRDSSSSARPGEALAQPLPASANEALDESEGSVGDLAPTAVDDQGMPAVRHLDDLGHSRIAFLLLVGRVRDRPRHGVVFLSVDDQEGSAGGILGVDLRLCPRVEVRGCRLEYWRT